jgi:hypothetical protein
VLDGEVVVTANDLLFSLLYIMSKENHQHRKASGEQVKNLPRGRRETKLPLPEWCRGFEQ